MNTPNTPDARHAPDEPEITQEESVPTDGRDIEGEAMMKDVRNKKLEEPGDREHKTPGNADAKKDDTDAADNGK